MARGTGSPTIRDGIAAIRRRRPELRNECADDPIFILAAGWRTGSTLLQRLLSHACLIWGEPYGHSGQIELLAEPIRAFCDAWPEPHFFYQGGGPELLIRRFIANLYPPLVDLISAHQAFLLRLLAEPARRAGAPRWGLKEVRLDIDHAAYLRWLFPRARILLLTRNPYDAYRSYAARRDAGWEWYRRWPHEPLTTARFAGHWRALTEGFLDGEREVDGLVVRYEDLAAGRLDALARYLGFPPCDAALGLNPTDDGPPPLAEIPAPERDELEREVGTLAARLGYLPTSHPPPRGPSPGAAA